MNDKDTQKPEFRYRLKGRIIGEGYRTLSDFAEKAGINLSILSRIVSGWELPGPRIQKKMAWCLGITLKELRELL